MSICCLSKLSPCKLAFVYIGIGIGAIIAALVAEHFFDMQPCFLCLTQRIPYIFIAVFGVAMLIRSGAERDVKHLLYLIVLAFLIGGGVGVYQVGGEQDWWQLAAGCSAGGIADVLAKGGDIREFLHAQQHVVPCDVVSFEIMGLSFAALNAIFSGIMTIVTVCLARRIGR